MRIGGISAGCLSVDSIFIPILECFYNQTCVNELISLISPMETFTATNGTKKNQYNLNSTVKSFVDRLMVKESVSNIVYEKYHSQCALILSKNGMVLFLYLQELLVEDVGDCQTRILSTI
jgi:hypothetical protein